jgi:hypothetical protein
MLHLRELTELIGRLHAYRKCRTYRARSWVMCKLSWVVLCVGLMLATCSSADAKGGTYHHAEFVPLSAVKATKKAVTAPKGHPCPCFTGGPLCTR